MPLADNTAIANLALSHLGEPLLTDLETDVGTTAAACRLHLPQCRETVLEGHVWSFATRTMFLVPVDGYLPVTGNIGYYASVGDYIQPSATPENDLPFVSEFSSLFILPEDCLRILKIATGDIDVPTNRFEIQGRYLLLNNGDTETEPLVHYIQNNPPVNQWPTTFTDAVSYLLASRLAPLLTQNGQLASQMMQQHEIALGKARSKDARETRSKENNTPRGTAARSPLVNSRFNKTARPPYA